MPRFGLSSLGSSPPTSSGFDSPSLRFPTMQSPPMNMNSPSQQFSSPSSTLQSPPSQRNNTANASNQLGFPNSQTRRRGEGDSSSSSVNLCCFSGDGGAVFSLGFQQSTGYFIERRTLPLGDETTAINPSSQMRLPQRLQTLLELSPPVELFYAGADEEAGKLQLLCLYSRKDVFYVEVGPQSIEDISHAFQNYFQNNADEDKVTIVRIRPAPQRRNGYATLCPRGAMAMLAYNPDYNEYSLVLQHKKDQTLVSSPLVFSLEEISGREDQIADFCFAQSEGLGLLSSLTVLMIKGSGDVMAASPIVFDGCVVPSSKLEESIDFLEYQIQSLPPKSPKSNQAKAAKMFLKDAFLGSNNGNESSSKALFRTAKVISEAPVRSAVHWPVQIQGPLLSLPRDHLEVANHAVVIENFSASDIIGIAVGGEEYSIDLGIVSPSCLLPRFNFETPQDGHEIDEGLWASGAVVQRLVLTNDQDSSSTGPLNNQSLSLIRDPLLDTMIHYVTATGVTTANTTAIRQVLRKIQGGGAGTDTPQTSAWSSMVASSSQLEGVIVAGNDARFGHAMIARLSNGTMVPVNLTEARYLYQMDSLIHGTTDEKKEKQLIEATPSGAAEKQLDSVPPLYEKVEPLMKKITSGLASMGKVVGSQTKCKDIQPDMMAVAISIKERCDKEVVLPMLELKETVNARREVLIRMREDQMKQITSLKQTANMLQDKIAEIEAKVQTAQENSKGLARRSTAVLQASQDLLPKLTQAEFDYFQQLKRLKANLDTMQEGFTKLDKTLVTLRESMDSGKIRCSAKVSSDVVSHAQVLLDGQEKFLGDMEASMNANEERTSKMMSAAGLAVLGSSSETPSEALFSESQ